LLRGWEVDRGGVARAEIEKTEAAMNRLNHVRRIMDNFFITPTSLKIYSITFYSVTIPCSHEEIG
jgi:hypothetical protein